MLYTNRNRGAAILCGIATAALLLALLVLCVWGVAFDRGFYREEYHKLQTADYVGTAAAADDTPTIETPTDLVAEVGSSVSSALRTVLIVLAVLTVLAGIALIILSSLEKKERQRIARRRAARERRLREQALEAAGMLPRSGGNAPADGSTRVPRSRE